MKNTLAGETSPYLLQHADNPVHWQPWDEAALRQAREQDKPILLSVGYSACHWCHVMAHESFENDAIAALMNEHFVNIKVDREERPDLDRIYQTAHQLLTQRPGGWPLTVFLEPDSLIPFFAGTYFPGKPRHGLPGFPDLLLQIAQWYRENPDQLTEHRQQMSGALQQLTESVTPEGKPVQQILDDARQQLQQHYDAKHGGFGPAPKFPHPGNIERLLRHWHQSLATQQDHDALAMARHTLTQMANGGINDQIGGGFCRYSVDGQWMIPHFEKMLYDNGQLLALYAQAWAATGDALFHDTACGIAHWIMREMQSLDGGYYASQDADAEGEEGKYYVWTPDEVQEVLDDDEYAVLAPHYGLDRQPNFEGRWHPHVFTPLEDVARQLGLGLDEANRRLTTARRKLYERRAKRIHPGRDDKLLTSWNALTIRGMAIAARHLQRPDWLASANRALQYLYEHHWRNGRLLATGKDGKVHLNAYLDDYAYLLDALLELLQLRWDNTDLRFACELADVLLDRFEDKQQGGFFFTSDDHEALIQRPKPFGDDAIPSGNGIAAYTLQRLGYLLGDSRYIEAAERTLQAAAGAIETLPHAHAALLLALEEQAKPPEIMILRGHGEELGAWHSECVTPYTPRRLAFAILSDINGLPDALSAKSPIGAACAYRCVGHECHAPITDHDTLTQTLRSLATNTQ